MAGPIFVVSDGPAKGTQIYDYGKGPVHIDPPESIELQTGHVPVVPISGATYDKQFAGL